MRTRTLLATLATAAFATSPAAQAWQYRGPGHVLPPAPGVPVPNAGPRHHPGIGPGPPPLPGKPTPGGPGPRSQEHRDDLAQWQFWWELQKDALLFPRLAPTRPWAREGTRRELVRRLHDVLSAPQQPQLTIACLLALAKADVDDARAPLSATFRARLADRHQAVRRAAILALGLSLTATAADRDLLAALALDTGAGRAAIGGEVDPRTRAHAVHALGLLASRSDDVATKRIAAAAFMAVLDHLPTQDHELRVATVLGLGQLGLRRDRTGHAALLDAAATTLDAAFAVRGAADLSRAHVPSAAARLFGPHDPCGVAWRERCNELLGANLANGAASTTIARSCVQALGRLATAYGEGDERLAADRCSDTLADLHHRGGDELARDLAAIALAEIGGARNLRTLLDAFAEARARRRPWLALALGVHLCRRPPGTSCADDAEATAALRAELRTDHPPGDRAAIAIALGLGKVRSAAADLRALCGQPAGELAGSAWLAGALLDDERDGDRRTRYADLPCTARRPDLARLLAWAVALDGDAGAARRLAHGLREQAVDTGRMAAVAQALGRVRDPGSLPPLLELLLDVEAPDLLRANAAGALGCWLDPRPVPWNAALADGLPWTCATESLFGIVGVVTLY
jgi:hypothetical protein